MANFLERTALRGGAALVAGIVGGPAAAYIAWKGVGFALTGNPFFLIPGGSVFGEGSEVLASAADGVDLDGPGFNGHGNPNDLNVHGTRPSDIHGNALGNDPWGNPNNRGIHG